MRILNRITLPTGLIAKKRVIIPVAAGIIAFAVLFALVLSPTQKKIASKRKEWKSLEAQLSESRVKQSMAYKIDKAGIEAEAALLKRRLPSKSDTSAIIDELTRKGKALNIEFITIDPQEERSATPGSRQSAEGFRYSVMPIDIDMRATFRSTGEYLNAIDNLESGFATVDNVQISKDIRIFPKLKVRMTVSTYSIEEEIGQK
ncbi:MAG: type 4a pilus biogenesis protein PilO [Candidatus Omnitrophota bacterium]|jgi:Tfp pilus assembly protein PilO